MELSALCITDSKNNKASLRNVKEASLCSNQMKMSLNVISSSASFCVKSEVKTEGRFEFDVVVWYKHFIEVNKYSEINKQHLAAHTVTLLYIFCILSPNNTIGLCSLRDHFDLIIHFNDNFPK